MKNTKSYHELCTIDTFQERYDYLKLDGSVGTETFGWDRYMNQAFYSSPQWKKIRDKVILRDNGCEMGLSDYPIMGKIVIHHINPIPPGEINTFERLNTDNLICVSQHLHNSLHYGESKDFTAKERTPNDTCPWKK